jgi:hypothetical protein
MNAVVSVKETMRVFVFESTKLFETGMFVKKEFSKGIRRVRNL